MSNNSVEIMSNKVPDKMSTNNVVEKMPTEVEQPKPDVPNMGKKPLGDIENVLPDRLADGTTSDAVQPMTTLFLDELSMGVTGTIVVMICRIWDVNAVTGRYLGTDFVVSDAKGNAIHCTAKANIAHTFLRLKEGVVYSIKDFVVQGNKDEYRIFKDDAFILEFDGATTVRKSSIKFGGFQRYPLQLQPIGTIQPTNGKYLIDVVGYVTNVGRTTHQKTGSRTLDFYLADGRGLSIRVTLWGGLGETLIEKKTKHNSLYAVVLTAVNAKYYNNKLYLSSSSSTLILDDPQIPALKALKGDASESEEVLQQAHVYVDHSQPKDGTLENVLLWARNKRNESATFNCRVRIDNVRTRKGWNYPSCGSDTCKKGATRKGGSFWCDACNKAVDFPVLKYRLELDVSDKIASAVVVMFDETATELVKCSAESLAGFEDESPDGDQNLPRALLNIIGATPMLELKSHTYYEHGTFESFTCWKIVPEEVVEESACSTTAAPVAPVKPPKLRRLTKHPSVSTPAKPTEDKKDKRYIVDDSESE